jgi:hypothetical protein
MLRPHYIKTSFYCSISRDIFKQVKKDNKGHFHKISKSTYRDPLMRSYNNSGHFE